MYEVHIGLPVGAGNPDSFDGFDFRQVFDTSPGNVALREYAGHGVDGKLGYIGTAWLDLPDFETHISEFAPKISEVPGARWEFEAVRVVDIDSAKTSLRGIMGSAEISRLVESVPAPDFERHIKVSNGQTSEELRDRLRSLLADVEYFELTTFGPDRPKAIVTVAGNLIDEVNDQTLAVADALRAEAPIVGDIESILGAYRPTLSSV